MRKRPDPFAARLRFKRGVETGSSFFVLRVHRSSWGIFGDVSGSFAPGQVSQLHPDVTSTALAVPRERRNSFTRTNRSPLGVLVLIPTHFSSHKDRLVQVLSATIGTELSFNAPSCGPSCPFPVMAPTRTLSSRTKQIGSLRFVCNDLGVPGSF